MKECLRQRNVFSGLQRASHNQDPPRDGILEEVLTEKERTRAKTWKLQHWEAICHSFGPCRNRLTEAEKDQLTATDMLQVSAWMWPRHSLFTKLYESLKSVVKAKGAGIAESVVGGAGGSCHRKVAGSNFCTRSGGRIFFSRVNFLSVLILISVSVPPPCYRRSSM